MTWTSLAGFIRESYRHWSDRRASRMGAALSFYAIFSIVPLLALIVLIAGASLGRTYIQTELTGQITGIVGSGAAGFIQDVLSASIQTGGALVSVISFGILLVGTFSMLSELRSSMDDLWGAPDANAGGQWLKGYVVSLSLVPVLALLLIASIFFSAVLSLAGTHAMLALKIGNLAFTLLLATALFAFVYRYIPARRLPWSDILRGAFSTALLFLAGRYAIQLYLEKFAGISVYGAAGALAAILLWIYYSVQIFFFGASMTYVWAKRRELRTAEPL